MARGTFTATNKVRPGVYINFKAAARPGLTAGSRGIMTFPVELPWGNENEAISVTANDFVTGSSIPLIGLSAADTGREADLFRLAFTNCYTVKAGRINTGGATATATIGTGVVATAKFPGTLGNSLSIRVVTLTGGVYQVSTLLSGLVKDTQNIKAVADFNANDWLSLSGDGALTATAGTPLSGGANGTVGDPSYTAYFAKMQGEVWNTMAIPSESVTLPGLAASYINTMRDTLGNKVQVVVCNYNTADYEGVISIDDDYYTSNGAYVSAADATVYVAGATAGAALNQSNTYHIIKDAVRLGHAKTDAETEAALQVGKMVFTKLQNGNIVIEKDINTLHTFSATKNYDFSKNRVIRTLDDIATQITRVFESGYIGKVDNNESGRGVFKGEVVGYLTTLQAMGAIQNFDAAADIEVMAGVDKDTVICNLAIQPVDAMEKLYMTVTIE